MAAYMSSDASAAEDSEGSSSWFCFMHVINTHSKVIPFSEKNMKEFQECAAKWIDVEGSPVSKVTVKVLQVHHSQHRLSVGIAAAVATDAAPGDDHDECDGSGRSDLLSTVN